MASKAHLAIALGATLLSHVAPKHLDRFNKSLAIADISVRLLDCYSTERMLSRGHRELFLPSVIASSPTRMCAFSAGATVVEIHSAKALQAKHPRLEHLLYFVQVGSTAYWATHNLTLK